MRERFQFRLIRKKKKLRNITILGAKREKKFKQNTAQQNNMLKCFFFVFFCFERMLKYFSVTKASHI